MSYIRLLANAQLHERAQNMHTNCILVVLQTLQPWLFLLNCECEQCLLHCLQCKSKLLTLNFVYCVSSLAFLVLLFCVLLGILLFVFSSTLAYAQYSSNQKRAKHKDILFPCYYQHHHKSFCQLSKIVCTRVCLQVLVQVFQNPSPFHNLSKQ